MAKPFITLDEPGKVGLAIGNDAIARGAYEAGVIVGSGYPGTPSSEILKMFAFTVVTNKEKHINVEWSINEKVGFEVAYGASMCNARALATMKHVGVNVATASFMSACYTGAKGGMVLLTADDPTMHSSQNEQDNRFYAKQALVPMFEPSTVQEAKDMMKYAFEFSEKFNTIVLYRTTTRLNHGRGDLTLGTIERLERDYKFDKTEENRWNNFPSTAPQNKLALLKRLEKITEFAEEFPFTSIVNIEDTDIGIITSGVAYAHTTDVMDMLKIRNNVSLFKLGLVWPLPRKKLTEFMKQHKKIIIVEELEPVLEQEIKSIAFEEDIDVEIHGKDLLPQINELFPEVIGDCLARFLDLENIFSLPDLSGIMSAPPRPPVLCAGCGHRNIYKTVELIERRHRLRNIHASDIGCYTLGFYTPLNAIDTCICMGGSTGMANGFAKTDPRFSMGFLGDSTFFHSGIAGLVNAVYNENDVIIVIMNNESTSMTGHQDHPGTGIKIDRTPGQKIDYRKICEGIGVAPDHIFVPDSNNLEELEDAFETAFKLKGVRVVIPTSLCALLSVGKIKKGIIKVDKYEVICDSCCEGEYCLRTFGCPAMCSTEDGVVIDTNRCTGCTFCSQVCPRYAIKPIEKTE